MTHRCFVWVLSLTLLCCLPAWAKETFNHGYDKPVVKPHHETTTVILNVKDNVFHRHNCPERQQCSLRNCFPVTRKEALERGAHPHAQCGG